MLVVPWCALNRKKKIAVSGTCWYFHCVRLNRERKTQSVNRLVGQVVNAFAPKAEIPDFESRLRRDFSGSSHTSDLKIGTPVATLPGVWRYRVSAETGWPGVSVL